jgi:exopolysaccharide production protein ExoZ
MSKLENKLFSVQISRGFAATMVVFAHASAHPLGEAPVWTWVAGRIGITLFFVISGFIMVKVTGPDGFNPVRFMRHRLLRIVPLYWTITLLSAVAAVVAPSLFHKTIFDPLHLGASLFFVPMLRPGNPGMIEPFVKLGWTLNYEMFFYFVFATLFALRSRARGLVLALIFIALVTIGQVFEPNQTQIKFYTSYDLVAFLVGCALGIAHQEGRLDGLSVGAARLLGVFSLLAIPLVFWQSTTKEPRLDRQFVLIGLSAGILVAGLTLEARAALARNRVLLFIGDASYSLYLAHMFAVGAVAVIAHRLFGPSLDWPQYLLTVVAGLAGGFIFGAAAFLFVERPFMKWTSKAAGGASRQVAVETPGVDLAARTGRG